MNPTASFYSRPSYVSGAGTTYSGARRQRGGSIFGALKSVVTPLLSTVGKTLKRSVLSNAVGFAGDVVNDIASGQNIKSTLLNRGKEFGLRTLQESLTRNRQKKVPKRMNVRRKRKQGGCGKKRTSNKTKKRHSRKRRARCNLSSSAKRRRCHDF